MGQEYETGRPEPRSEAVIFEDLRALAQSEGALHEISNLIYRDHVVTVDRHEGRVVDDAEYRWSTSKLNKNEMLLLLGLMVQSSTERTYVAQSGGDGFLARADALFGEFHDRVVVDFASTFNSETRVFVEQKDFFGLFGREAIYYGAEGLYLHQLLTFSRNRYREDTEWLLRNVGISIRPMLDITKFVLDRINLQMTVMGHLRKDGQDVRKADLANSLLIPKEDVKGKFGNKAEAFFEKFVTPITSANEEFTDPFAINSVALAPIIELARIIHGTA